MLKLCHKTFKEIFQILVIDFIVWNTFTALIYKFTRFLNEKVLKSFNGIFYEIFEIFGIVFVI